MGTLSHALVFLLSAGVIWFFSGILIDSTYRVAKRFNRSGFSVAFLMLGFLTSISEISVAVNATFENIPQISAGNLFGASFVIFLLIIPLLAIFGGGISLSHSFNRRHLLLALLVIGLPSFLAIDGRLDRREGFLMLGLYAVLLYFIERANPMEHTAEKVKGAFLRRVGGSAFDLIKVVAGGALIFFASKILVEEAVYFSDQLLIPASFVGLLVLSIGTNVPELVIAIRSIIKKHKDIAFGDYVGSAAANTFILGGLVLANGAFRMARMESLITATALALGLFLFFLYSKSDSKISRREGVLLVAIYVAFVILQILTVPATPPGLER